jgi:hypothetical protein
MEAALSFETSVLTRVGVTSQTTALFKCQNGPQKLTYQCVFLIQSSRYEFLIQHSRSEFLIQPSRSQFLIQPSRSEFLIQPCQSEFLIQPSRSEFLIQPTRSVLISFECNHLEVTKINNIYVNRRSTRTTPLLVNNSKHSF